MSTAPRILAWAGAQAARRPMLARPVAWWAASRYSGSGSLLDQASGGHAAALPGGMPARA